MNDSLTPSPAVIFDVDGVLIDSMPAHFEAFSQFGVSYGIPTHRELFHSFFGLHNNEIFPRWFGRTLQMEQIIEYTEEKERLYRNLAPLLVKPITGARELILWLAERQVPMAIGSSGPRKNVEIALNIIGFQKAFGAIVTGDDVRKGKPDPEIFLKAAELLKVQPHNCIVIEDAIAGICAAKAGRMRVIALTSSLPRSALKEADFVVDHLEDVSSAWHLFSKCAKTVIA